MNISVKFLCIYVFITCLCFYTYVLDSYFNCYLFLIQLHVFFLVDNCFLINFPQFSHYFLDFNEYIKHCYFTVINGSSIMWIILRFASAPDFFQSSVTCSNFLSHLTVSSGALDVSYKTIEASDHGVFPKDDLVSF